MQESPEQTSAAAPAQAAAAHARQQASLARQIAAAQAQAEAQAETKGPGQLEDAVGFGVNIVEVARMEAVLGRCARFRKRVFTPAERDYCDKSTQRATSYALRFAAKQAVLKSLQSSFWQGVSPLDVEILRNSKGHPFVKLHGKPRRLAHEMGVLDLPVSLSWTHNEAVACAMAITRSSQSAAKKRKDPMQELSQQFKQARSLLDSLPPKAEKGSGE